MSFESEFGSIDAYRAVVAALGGWCCEFKAVTLAAFATTTALHPETGKVVRLATNRSTKT